MLTELLEYMLWSCQLSIAIHCEALPWLLFPTASTNQILCVPQQGGLQSIPEELSFLFTGEESSLLGWTVGL